jgi:hypothetical protein
MERPRFVKVGGTQATPKRLLKGPSLQRDKGWAAGLHSQYLPVQAPTPPATRASTSLVACLPAQGVPPVHRVEHRG